MDGLLRDFRSDLSVNLTLAGLFALGGLAGFAFGVAFVPRGVPVGDVTVWSQEMMVETDTVGGDSYSHMISPSDNVLITHEDVDYAITHLFVQEHDDGRVRQLVLSADKTLPDDVVVQIGDSLFPVADALKLGSNGNIHTWRLDESSLVWSEGEAIVISLIDL